VSIIETSNTNFTCEGGRDRSKPLPEISPKGWYLMKIFLNILAVLLILAGGVWFLQGVNILPGSFMTGQPQWAYYGGATILVGVGLIVLANRRKA
jgi:hypothetical protein